MLPEQDRGGSFYDPLAELAALADAAGAIVVDRVVQRRPRICPATYIGRGKADELARRVADKQSDVVIFDNDLSPSQIRELERLTERKVIDRTELILDIFASRARTRAARLQVELAQLEYTAPRLRGMWSHLERIAGAGGGTAAGAVGGIGTRGPGERQIEIDRRIVQKRTTFLRQQIRQLDERKLREVRSRSDYPTVGLVGYTNAGKSTLMNALTGAGTLVEDKLFATLDTKTRRWNLGDGQIALLSDTVGFVRDLPHQLVASFRATLEEAIHADVLLHVVDAASPDAEAQIRAVDAVLAELGCADSPTILVFNKIDAVRDGADLPVLRAKHPDAVEISARTGLGIDRLTLAVTARLRGRYVHVRAEADATNGKLLAYVNRHGQVIDREYVDGTVVLRLRLPPAEIPRIRELGARVAE
ncbi:MAG: GTPase HflX [Phycisphaerae bacterium]|nr:GTPase HflX [Phycisphaerae bacterium]